MRETRKPKSTEKTSLWSGQRLQYRRWQLNWSLRVLALEVGVQLATVARWCYGRTEPSFSNAARLCRRLEVPVEFFRYYRRLPEKEERQFRQWLKARKVLNSNID